MVLREAQRIGLTDAQRELFERDGYLVVEDALDADLVSRLTDAVDRVWAAHRDAPPVAGADPLHLLAFVGRDPLFLELLDHEPILRLVVDLLGWNVFMHHCHLDVHPPVRGPSPRPWMWHQDGGIQNHDLETHPRPRMSVKVAYFLTGRRRPRARELLRDPRVTPARHDRPAVERRQRSGAARFPCSRDPERRSCSTAASGTCAARTDRPSRGRRCSTPTRSDGCVRATTSGSRPSSSERSRRSARSCWAPARARSAIGCRKTTTCRCEGGGRRPTTEARPVSHHDAAREGR